MTAEREKCRAAALKYVSYGMRTKGKTAEYLAKKGFEEETVADALKMLEEYGYLDDAAYCRSYYIESCRRGKGRRRIEYELTQKKIPPAVVREALDELLSEENPDYEEIAAETLSEKERAMELGKKLLRRQLEDNRQPDEAFCGRVGRRLSAMGYSLDIVYAVIKEIKKERSDE